MGLRERICKDDWKRRWMLFRYLVKSVMEYGVEIWGWKEKKILERIMLDYVRWCFRLEFCTLRYLITRKLGLERLKIRWGIRTRKYEVKIKDIDKDRWIGICWREKEEGGWIDRYGKERKEYY